MEWGLKAQKFSPESGDQPNDLGYFRLIRNEIEKNETVLPLVVFVT